MKYRATQPFVAFGKTPEPGDVVELTEEQAEVLAQVDCIAPYEVKIQPPLENKEAKKPLGLSHPAPARRKRMLKRLFKSATK